MPLLLLPLLLTFFRRRLCVLLFMKSSTPPCRTWFQQVPSHAQVAPAVLALVISCEYSLKRFLLQEALGGAVVVLVITLCRLCVCFLCIFSERRCLLTKSWHCFHE
jgi:hypothetical protein